MKKTEREKLLLLKLEEMKAFESALYSRGIRYIAGVDEVGRGPLAGPVVAAAVILPKDFSVLGVDDSKKLSAKKREQLCEEILENAVAYGIGRVENTVIDEINILEATKLAMREAIAKAEGMLYERKCARLGHVLIDAVRLEGIETPQTPIIKGDSKSVSIAAASIVAKVTRDAEMVKYHEIYPYYAFDSNKGYGTAAHYEGLKQYGLTPIHRKSFLKNLDEK